MKKNVMKKILIISTTTILFIGNTFSVQALATTQNSNIQNLKVNINKSTLNGWTNSDGINYYYENGFMKTGWLYDEYGETYYLNDDGSMKTGWLSDEYGEYYYFNTNGTMKTGWLYDEYGETYYLNSNGTMQTNWLSDKYGEHYYFNPNGTMKTGWFNDSYGETYYLNNNGTMQTGNLTIGEKTYSFNDNGTRNLKLEVIAEAEKHIGKPYVYGSTGPNSFDCSGFTGYVYSKAHGIELGRSTYNQMNAGIPVSRADLQTGDLIFTSPGHVGIYIGDNQMLHAPRTGDYIKTSSVFSFYKARRIL